MPFYEFKCLLGHVEEILIHKIDDRDSTPQYCPECFCPMKRIISSSGIKLKGHGWAKDGYGNKMPKEKEKKKETEKGKINNAKKKES